MAILNPGNLLNSVPAQRQQTLSSNYLDFTATATAGWAQQYLPDLMEKEAEVFGPRTISGFLAQVGAEEAMTSDQVVWSEQGRLHLSYKGKVSTASSGLNSSSQILIQADIDGADSDNSGISNGHTGEVRHGIRPNDTIIIADATNNIVKAVVTKVATDTIDVSPYGSDTLSTTANQATTILVYGSEFSKGVTYTNEAGTGASDSRKAIEPRFKSFTNKPIIMKDYYEVSGSDASRIGLVEVSAENGQSGYLWYLKS